MKITYSACTLLLVSQLAGAVDHVQPARPPAAPPPPPTPPVGAAIGMGTAGDHAGLFLSTRLGGTGAAGRSLVVVDSEPDGAQISSTEEDLNIMSRLLDKAIEDGKSDDKLKSMGIDLHLWKPGSQTRNFYLQGYGALFLLKVKFPLSAPASPAKDKPEKEETSSAWEEARQEVYGRREMEFDLEKQLRGALAGTPPAYDSKRVETLKENLLSALKHASNIRQLKPDEVVTIIVTGDVEGGRELFTKRIVASGYSRNQQPHATVVEPSTPKESGKRAESMLVIRVKKSAVDAFAKGDMKEEEFKSKATVLLY